MLAKRSAIENVKGFSELRNIHEDYDLWIRLLINGSSFIGIESPLAYYRSHPGSSSGGEGKMLFFTINSLQHIKALCPKFSVDINRSICDLINDHLAKVNINRWDIACHLLELRNSLSKENISISFWKRVYFLFGKNIFRMLFNLKAKKKPTIADDRQLMASVI